MEVSWVSSDRTHCPKPRNSPLAARRVLRHQGRRLNGALRSPVPPRGIDMSEVTRVPLQPIEKGSVLKIWLGVLVALLIGLGVAWAMHPRGLSVETLAEGKGESPTASDVVLINYVGRLASGKEFDRGEKAVIPLESVMPGFRDGLQKMKKGGKYRLEIPSNLAYGDKAQPDPRTGEVVIPANSDLVFEIELLNFMTSQQFQAMQQMLQMQGGPGGSGGPGGAPGESMPPLPPATQP
jgi:FKBP-type peptidyl-prolyl cis-trans isomerase FkpA